LNWSAICNKLKRKIVVTKLEKIYVTDTLTDVDISSRTHIQAKHIRIESGHLEVNTPPGGQISRQTHP